MLRCCAINASSNPSLFLRSILPRKKNLQRNASRSLLYLPKKADRCFRFGMEKKHDLDMLGEYLVKVENGIDAQGDEPSFGPVYRCIFAKDGLESALPGVESCWDIFSQSVQRNPSNRMLGYRKTETGKAGQYVWLTYQEVYDTTIKVGSAMKACELGSGNSCGVYAANSPEWVITMQACNSQGIPCVPLYDTLGMDAIEFIICHAEVSIVFADQLKVEAVLRCFPRCKHYLKTLVVFSDITKDQRKSAEDLGLSVYTWLEFQHLGESKKHAPLPPQRDSICTIMYTSGTMGEPKGVVLNNENIIAEIAAVDKMFRCTNAQIYESDAYISYLPLAHIFEFSFVQHFIHLGASIGFWRSDPRLLLEDIIDLKPTVLVGVPRVFERLYIGINAKISAGGDLMKKLFEVAYSYKLKNMQKGLKYAKAAPLFDKLIFSKIKESLGGHLRFIISGGAPLPRPLEEFFRVASCSSLIQGYGLTETCSGIISSLHDVFYMIGTVGIPNTGVEIRLRSVPEMGYNALSDRPCGEICVKGKNIFTSYHKREDLTNEAFVNGWFCTGDIGELLPDGTLKIIDRKKNIFKLSQGEYIAVEKLENAYRQCATISSIWIHGDSFRSFLVAVVVPDAHAVRKWADTNGEKGDFESLCKNKNVNRYILDALNATGKEQKVKGFEKIKAIHLESKPFDLERGLITPTFKLRRSALLEHYKDVIDSLYKSCE